MKRGSKIQGGKQASHTKKTQSFEQHKLQVQLMPTEMLQGSTTKCPLFHGERKQQTSFNKHLLFQLHERKHQVFFDFITQAFCKKKKKTYWWVVGNYKCACLSTKTPVHPMDTTIVGKACRIWALKSDQGGRTMQLPTSKGKA